MGITRKKWFFLSAGIALVLFFVIDGALLPALSSRADPYQPFKLLSQVVYLVKNDYVEEPDADRTMQGALKGLVDSLDVLSSYLEPPLVERYRDRKSPRIRETGIILYKNFGVYPVVIGIKPGSPAEKSEIRMGDSISAIDGVSTLGMSMLETNLAVQHASADSVELRLVRAPEDRNIEVKHAVVNEDRFSFTPAEGAAGILTIHSIYPPLSDQLEQHLAGLNSNQLPLILDFRTCAEGSLDEAVRLVNLFVKKKRIGWLEGRDNARTPLSAPAEAAFARIPLAVWTSQATIGPAEIVAFALQKHHGADVIGQKTLGLGARREFFPLPDGSGLVLTTAVFRPEGDTVFWKKGIEPDVLLAARLPDQEAFLKATFKDRQKR